MSAICTAKGALRLASGHEVSIFIHETRRHGTARQVRTLSSDMGVIEDVKCEGRKQEDNQHHTAPRTTEVIRLCLPARAFASLGRSTAPITTAIRIARRIFLSYGLSQVNPTTASPKCEL